MVEVRLRIDFQSTHGGRRPPSSCPRRSPVRDELALYGGEKTAREPFPPWPQFAEKTLTEIVEPLRSGRLSYWSGLRGREFEAAWASWIGAAHAISCSSGTAALHTALLGLGISPGDEVIVPSHTFLSTSLAALHAGAVPVFCDVADDQTIDPRALETMITDRTRAIIVVHLYGVVCAMDRIIEVALRHGIPMVEDCAQSVGGEFRGRKTGTIGDAGCFSFSEGKHVSTGGEGGMIVTRSDALAAACRCLRDYGREQGGAEQAAHVRVGYNYRLTEIQSIIGKGELDRLDTWNLPRRAGFAKTYDHAFAHLYGVRALPLNTPDRRNAYWKYPLQLDLEKLTCGGEECRRAIVAEGIPEAGGRWPESYEEPVFARRVQARCPNAEALRERTVVLGLPPVGASARGAVRRRREEGPARVPQMSGGQPWGVSPGGLAFTPHPQELYQVLSVQLLASFQHVERHLVGFFDRLTGEYLLRLSQTRMFAP
jgi:dTDP-4-amino-4,6-dideoxygalactose transaminase